MFELIAKLLPDWLMPALFGVAVWYGINYVFLTGFIGERIALKHCPIGQQKFCICVANYLANNAKFELSLFTASVGYYKVDNNEVVIKAKEDGMKKCQS
ncbi:MAG: hypothetical protein KDJ52_33115 [Anaerolineae bacterium]|nr:hypothetical protein [Anaerolineae bacterium]MCB1808713.1 hypothetical protein [Candidatus Competibacteraceae bacterium]